MKNTERLLNSYSQPIRKLAFSMALLAFALPAFGLDFSKTAPVYQPKNFAAADINYFEEMQELFDRAEAPSPSDLKTSQKGQLALKNRPLSVRQSRIALSFDGKTRFVCVDKQGDEKTFTAFDIVSTLPESVAGSGKVQLRKSGNILLARIMSGKDVLGYAVYGSPKAQEAAPVTPKAPAKSLPMLVAKALPSPKILQPAAPASKTSPIQIAAPQSVKPSTSKLAALPLAATMQAAVPPLPETVPAKQAVKRNSLSDKIISVISGLEKTLDKTVKGLTESLELVKDKLEEAAKKHPLAVKVGIGVALAAALAALGISAYFVFQSGILSFLTSTVVGTALQVAGKKVFQLIFKKPKPPKA